MFSAHNISFQYAENTPFIFEDINFSLAEKEILVIIGESGAGKSSLLNILGGFFPPTDGFLMFENKKLPSPLTQLVAGFKNIKLVTQDTKLLPNHTILENIIFPIRNLSQENQQEKLSELLKIFHLEDLKNRTPRQISGGQRQRATIAQSLASSPDVLLLDEPFSHLDNENRIILRNILREISAQDTSIILVTHQAQEALELGDKIAVLAQKKIIQIDTPQNIYQKPISQKVASLLGNVVFLDWKNEKKAIRPEKIQIFWEKVLPSGEDLGGVQEKALPSGEDLGGVQEKALPSGEGLGGVVKNVFFIGFYYEIHIILNETQNHIQTIFFGKNPPNIGQEVGIYFEESDFLW